jgi:hypothetical protein
MNAGRVKRLIDSAIADFELDLTSMVVLTEGATGYYALTPVIAALAGADRVQTLSRDSRFGTAENAIREVAEIAREFGMADRIKAVDRNDASIADADIVTNLGFVRPIDRPMLDRLKPTATISLMWETWEFRAQDLDLPRCRELGIPVLGTNEHHPRLRTFDYVGAIAVKLLLALEIEVVQSSVIVLGEGEFAEIVARMLKAMGASVRRVAAAEVIDAVRDADALVVVEHENRAMLVDARAVADANPSLAVAHICGGIEPQPLIGAPDVFAAPGSMSVATDYVGPKPLIDLHTAGLHVGELLARARRDGLPAREAELSVLAKCAFAQDFPAREGR